MEGGHGNQTHWIYKYFLHQYQRFVKLVIIIVMIIRTTYRIARHLATSIQDSFATAPQINYEHFFKQIQKSSNPIETIRVYDKYKEESMRHDQFIAITLRILTRSMRIGENDDPQAVKGFFERNIFRVKKINLKSLSVQYIKDIIIFYVHFFEHFKLKQQQIQLLNLCLQQFLVRFNQASNQKQIQLYSTVILLSIPLTHEYSQTYNEQNLKIVLSLLQNSPSKYIIDHEDFQIILHNFSTFQDLSNPIHKQIILLVFSKLKQLNIAQVFTQKRIVAIMTCILNMNRPILKDQQCATLIGEVYNQTENAFLAIFSTVKMYTFSRIIPTLLQLRPQSPILATFYGIINDSIVQQCKCKIDPRVVVMGISFLSRHQFYRYFSNQWAAAFAKMVKYYQTRNDLFFDGIIEKIFIILNAKTLDQNSSFELYRAIFDNINQSQTRQNRKTAKKLIMAATMHAKHGRLVEAEQSLLKAYPHFRLDKKQNNSISFNSNKIDLFAYYNKICVYQHNQKTILPGFANKEMINIQTRKFKFVTDLMCLLFNLKINLAYANLSHVQVQNTLRNSEIAHVRYIYNKEKVFKTVVFDSKFSEVHFPNAVQMLLKLYGNSISLQQNMSQFMKKRIQLHQQFSKQTVELIYFFYSKYHPQQFIQLIANDQYLLKAFLQNRYGDILRLILLSSNKVVFKKEGGLLLRKVIEFATHNLQRETALQMFREVSKFLPSIMQVLNVESQQMIFNALNECSFRHFIFDEEMVVKTMYSLSQQIKGSKQYQLQTKQHFLASLQLQLRQLVQNNHNKQKTSPKTVALFNKAITSLESLNDFASFRNYFTLLQSWITPQIIHHMHDTLNRLKNIAFKQGYSGQFAKLFFRFAINNRLYCNEFNKALFDKFTSQTSPDQPDYFSLFSYFPIQKNESVLYSFTQQVALNPIKNIVPFCMTYSLVANPSLQMRQFMTKLCIRYKKYIPSFFMIYLSEMDKQAAALIQVQQIAGLADLLSINIKGENKISVDQIKVKEMFQHDNIVSSNWWNISNNQIHQGVHLLITRKMLQKKYPNKQINFQLQKVNLSSGNH